MLNGELTCCAPQRKRVAQWIDTCGWSSSSSSSNAVEFITSEQASPPVAVLLRVERLKSERQLNGTACAIVSVSCSRLSFFSMSFDWQVGRLSDDQFGNSNRTSNSNTIRFHPPFAAKSARAFTCKLAGQ